jgi:hypothetical protein
MILNRVGASEVDKSAEFRGLSTDTKPTQGLNEGDVFLEMDTGEVYFWDGNNWITPA